MLTIISVSYKSKALLEMNYRLVKALNPNTPFRWIVVQNTPEKELENDLAMDDLRFDMVPGVALSENERSNIYLHSFHHAKALNFAVSLADSDLVLTLDPDCYLFMPNWIELITEYVKDNEIALFGTPYHPYSQMNYQGFPNAICMLINKLQLNQETLDFAPAVDYKRYKTPVYAAVSHHCSSFKRFGAFFIKSRRKHPLKLFDFYLIVHRFLCGIFTRSFTLRSCDTGYKIYKEHRLSLKYHALQVFAEDNRNLMVKCWDFFLPNFLRSYPRKTSLITDIPSPLFKDFGEEGHQFFWEGKLLAFHIQRSLYSEEGKDSIQERLFKRIEKFLASIEHY
jgi:hypothetical protein